MGLPVYYKFDLSLPGELEILFTEHAEHVRNFREHLSGKAALPCNYFDVLGGWEHGTQLERLSYSNGVIRRMRESVTLVFDVVDGGTPAAREWVERDIFPTKTEELPAVVRVPGRWFTARESAIYFLRLSCIVGPDEEPTDEDLLRRLEPLRLKLGQFTRARH